MLNELISVELIDKIFNIIKTYSIQTIITTAISTFITLKINKINERNILLNELHNIMKYSMEYPFLENEYFTNQYEIMHDFCKKHDILLLSDAAYSDMYGKAPVIETVHAGLECGLFNEKIANFDAVSLGPDMWDIHTVNERLSIASTERTYKYLCEVLRRL